MARLITAVIVSTGLVLFFPPAALPLEPLHACADGEGTITCLLQVQRNNALDELALSEASRRDRIQKDEETESWWKNYTSGVLSKQKWYDDYFSGLEQEDMGALEK